MKRIVSIALAGTLLTGVVTFASVEKNYNNSKLLSVINRAVVSGDPDDADPI